ncbi:hypothetical protein A2685_01465 [Candidatus Woesebacteria bacterium RIFCSPHIGHO2_01_FULL_37_10]|uniref:Uncharacterized protein n=1 Tax=Candidatus Woesebacteria bacterium RIFCSPHIGHO2_01_FULL_37_10 TaxID=1802489 RepID=A0A1F7XV66_9BACT|nr:MAG: hypothetical protein A2685_01465 [Candidatus Woesebacteria bacterium RIFCSPHIGHO2_01_FULL_37_10]
MWDEKFTLSEVEGNPTLTASKKKKEKTQKFKELSINLKWRNRWTQQEIAFCCPIAPLKKAISKIVESNINISKNLKN